MDDELQLRIYGDASLPVLRSNTAEGGPTLIYLPGLHGDWTLIGGFRHALGGRVRFVEVTYPRTLTWSLDDYAAAIEIALAKDGITGGWLLGESFGSQPLWALVGRNSGTGVSPVCFRKNETVGVMDSRAGRPYHLQIQGVILAGGFVKHPLRRAVRLAENITGRISNALFIRMVFGYARIARFRYRRSPETLANLQEFIARRTELDRGAAQHRLHLIAENDPRPIARRTKLPIFGLSGVLDPIVPWPWVRLWLRKNCPALRDYKVVRRADHNVLSTAPKEAAEQVLEWMNQ